MPEGDGALQVQHIGIAGQPATATAAAPDRDRDPVQGGRAVDGVGKHQRPFENWLPDNADDQVLVPENAPMIELIWNLRDVQLPVFIEPDRSQSPDPWLSIERAVYGFRDLVREREF